MLFWRCSPGLPAHRLHSVKVATGAYPTCTCVRAGRYRADAAAGSAPERPHAQPLLARGTGLSKLRLLDLSHNQLSRVPPCVPAGLHALYIGVNSISELPAWLPAHCPHLRRLDVHMNNVLLLHPDVLRALPLQMLACSCNPVLQGSGPLATALAQGKPCTELRSVAQQMTFSDWQAELLSLRGLHCAS